MSKNNKQYGVKPEVLKEIKFTPRDEELSTSSGGYENNLIQGILKTPPEDWNEGQLYKAKKYKLNTRNAQEIRWLMDNEVGGD
jgi:hypothetical protein